MIYIIIGIIIIFSIIILFYILDRILDCGLLDDPVLYIYAILFGIVCSCTIYGVKAPSMLQYEAYTENYELKKNHENQYYTTSTDGNSISVWIMDGKGWEKRTFSEEIVKFQPTDGKAEMQIHKKRIIEPSTADKILFFKGALVLYDEFVESVVISVPEESEIGETADTTQICTDCGAEILKKFQYCSGCGKKLE